MSHYAYETLDSSVNEIRILRFLDPPAGERNLVHCTLCHVSLDQLLPAYKDFKRELQFFSQKNLAKEWCESYFADRSWPSHETSTTLISASRYRAESQKLCDWSRDQADQNDNMPIPCRFTWGDFEALSYCWGSDIRDKIIIVDGLPLPVPTNFEEMLRHLQNLPESRSGMGFWADSVCINQTDLSEKESQIRLMKRIYAEASSTVIWLGPSHEGSDTAISVLNDYFGDCRPLSEDSWYLSSRSKNGISGQDWQSLLDLWSRDYFTRMWIIQELALNKSLSLFLCGNKQFPRLVLQDACHWIRDHAGDVAQAIMNSTVGNAADVSPDHVWSTSANVLELITLSTSENDIDKLYDLAHKSRVKEPHDKVYGLLGLLPDYLAAKIIPDYTKPIEVVFTEFATLLLDSCCRLDEVLSWSTLDAQSASPYWVPNWLKPHQRNHIQWFRKFSAGGTDRPGQVLLQDGKSLCCRGIYVDFVEHASVPSSQKLSYQTTCQPRLLLHRIDDPGNARRDALRRTLSHRHPGEQAGASLLDLQWVDWNKLEGSTSNVHILDKIHASSHHWQFFDSFRHTNANFMIFGWRLKDFFPQTIGSDFTDPFKSPSPSMETAETELDLQPPGHDASNPEVSEDVGNDDREESSEDHFDFESSALEANEPAHTRYATEHEDHLYNLRLTAVALRNRRLFTTRTGFLGLGPDEVHTGDTVAVLVGCNYPVVLRPHESGYKYVGECYIDGLMDGEAFEATNCTKYEIIPFLIF